MTMNAYRAFSHNIQGPVLFGLAYLCFMTHVIVLGWVATTLVVFSYLSHWLEVHRLVAVVHNTSFENAGPRVRAKQTIDN